MRKPFTIALLPPLLALTLSAGPSGAPASAQAQQQTELQYAAKLVCGRQDGNGLAAPGQYFTIVNVHNPSPNRAVKLRKKFARALPGEKVGKITPFFWASLLPDEALGIDCPDIYAHSGITPGTFIEGYVVIQSPLELDVVSVYTAGAPQVSTLHTERVPARRIAYVPPGCADLSLSLNTGVAPWRVISDPDTSTNEPRAASIITNVLWPSPWVNPQPGSQWIGSAANASGGAGKHTYEYCFCLCEGFKNASLTYRASADNSGTVSLNGTQIGTTAGFTGAPPTVTTNNQSLFKPGQNCVRVVVQNDSSVTGFDLAGTVTAAGGKCQTDGTMSSGGEVPSDK